MNFEYFRETTMKFIFLFHVFGVFVWGRLTLENHKHPHFIPKYPQSYTVKAIFSVPYAQIEEPVDVYTDVTNRRQKIEFYDGLDGYLYLDVGLPSARSFEHYIARDKKLCNVAKLDQKQVENENVQMPILFLPDLTDFEYKGIVNCSPHQDGKCHHWMLYKHQFSVMSHYSFYARDDEFYTPVLYSMVGYDVPFSSHYDMYKIKYIQFKSGVKEEMFNLTKECQEARSDQAEAHATVLKEFSGLFNSHDYIGDLHNDFKKKYAKAYKDGSVEHLIRNKHFRKNVAKINNLNRKGGEITYSVNHLADLSLSERQRINGYRPNEAYRSLSNSIDDDFYELHKKSGHKLPENVDWRRVGVVTPVKDQGKCGSCWAFGAAQAIESAWSLKYDELHVLSEQQIVDCSWDVAGNGCDGGDQVAAMKYIHELGGLMEEKDYKYKQEDGYCVFNKSLTRATVKKIVRIPKGDEESLKDALANHGPISIAFDAGHETLSFYSSGIYYDEECSSTNLDHAVLLVGYGITKDGEEFWTVKNSWSTYWGDSGYFKIARNRKNHCGIASDASYPIV